MPYNFSGYRCYGKSVVYKLLQLGLFHIVHHIRHWGRTRISAAMSRLSLVFLLSVAACLVSNKLKWRNAQHLADLIAEPHIW